MSKPNEKLVKQASDTINQLCKKPDTAMQAMICWLDNASIYEEAVKAIYDRIMADMDFLASYYFVRIMQSMPAEDRPVDIAPLIDMVMDIGDESLQKTLLVAIDGQAIDSLRQDGQA